MPWYSAGYQLPARLASSGQAMPHEMTAPIIMEMFTCSVCSRLGHTACHHANGLQIRRKSTK